jgi:hypothetical protein
MLDDARGKPDFNGDGEFCSVVIFLMSDLGVAFTCTILFERSSPGVAGRDGSSLSRYSLLGLDIVGMEVFVVTAGFPVIMIGRRRIDLKRSSLLGLLERSFIDSDLIKPPVLFIVADFTRRRGAVRLGLDGDLDSVGIWLGCLVLAARAREAWVGVVIELRIDRDRESVEVDGLLLMAWADFWCSIVRARFAGVFSRDAD